MLPRKLLLDVRGLQIDRHAAVRIDLACEGLAVNGHEPVVGIDLLRKRWQCWQDRMGDTRGSNAARPSLIWSLLVVMLHELLLYWLIESSVQIQALLE
jgi:hypothetical protein